MFLLIFLDLTVLWLFLDLLVALEHVALQDVLAIILHPALFTLERPSKNNKVNDKLFSYLPEVKVATQMILHVALGSEADATLV